MPYLKVVKGGQVGAVHEIEAESLTLGRDKIDTIQLNDQGASRQHAEVFRIGELYFLRDLESKNGTFLNEEQISEQALQIGDKIRIGGTVLSFEEDVSESAAERMAKRVQFVAEEERAPSSTIEINFRKELIAEAGADAEDQRLQVIYKISKMLGTTSSIHEAYERVLKMVIEALDADNGYIFEISDDKSLRPVMVVEKDSDKTAKVARSIIKQAMDHHKAVMTQDAARDPRFQGSQSIIMRKTSGVICAPLMSMDTLVGVIYLSVSRIGTPFRSQDLELVSVVAILLGMVMQAVGATRHEKEVLMNSVRALVDVIERRFPARKGHHERVVKLASAIGEEMNLSQDDLFQLRLAAWLHDIGRIASTDDDDQADDQSAPPEFLKKRATARAKLAREIAEDMHLPDNVLKGILHHAETLDGKGAPDGLLGLDIPIFARIISVAKTFDELLTFGGNGNEGLAIKDALIAINKESGKRYDAEAVQAMLVAYRKGALFKTK